MKYVCLWEADMSKWPTEPKERAAAMVKMQEMTKQWLKSHPGAEWGIFIGQHRGYSMAAGTPKQLMEDTLMFSPYIKFEVFQAANVDEYEEAFKDVIAKIQPK